MKNAHPVVAYYTALSTLLRADTFTDSSGEAVVALAEKHKADLSRKDVTINFLREAHEEYHGTGDPDIIQSLTEEAFADLAPHMHDINARKVFQRLMEMSGTFEAEDLFSHVSTVRFLGKDKNGLAIITLVVSSYKGLKDLLQNTCDSDIEYGHFSASEK